MFYVQYSFSENCAVYEIMRKNMIELDRPHIMLFAYWISKNTDKHSECVILIAFLLQQRLLEGPSILR